MNVEASIPQTVAREERAERRPPSRTCVGCGAHDDATEMVHLVMLPGEGGVGEELVFDALFMHGGGLKGGGGHGRGAHVHARPACLAKAPAGLARSLRRPVTLRVEDLGARLVTACERRMDGLLVSARRLRAVAVGADAALAALRHDAPLVVVATDAGSVVDKTEVVEAIAGGRAIAWGTKAALGGLLGEASVAICAVSHPAIATELKKMRACADAGTAATSETSHTSQTREGARCRRPEAR